jgi:hypothetical protein
VVGWGGARWWSEVWWREVRRKGDGEMERRWKSVVEVVERGKEEGRWWRGGVEV